MQSQKCLISLQPPFTTKDRYTLRAQTSAGPAKALELSFRSLSLPTIRSTPTNKNQKIVKLRPILNFKNYLEIRFCGLGREAPCTHLAISPLGPKTDHNPQTPKMAHCRTQRPTSSAASSFCSKCCSGGWFGSASLNITFLHGCNWPTSET